MGAWSGGGGMKIHFPPCPFGVRAPRGVCRFATIWFSQSSLSSEVLSTQALRLPQSEFQQHPASLVGKQEGGAGEEELGG